MHTTFALLTLFVGSSVNAQTLIGTAELHGTDIRQLIGNVHSRSAYRTVSKAVSLPKQLRICVRLNNEAAPKKLMNRAITEASWLFSHAGIETQWLAGMSEISPVSSDTSCAEDTHPFFFSVRVTLNAPAAASNTALGSATLYRSKSEAEVFYRRILESQSVDPDNFNVPMVFGATIAHEIAHLILGSNDHGLGLMRAHWGRQEFLMIGQHALVFSSRDRARLAERLRSWPALSLFGYPVIKDDQCGP